MAKDKFAKWDGTAGVTHVGREDYVDGQAEDQAAQWGNCTDSDPNRGTIRRGRSAWAKARS